MTIAIRDILASQNPRAISDLIEKSFFLSKKNRSTPKFGIRQLREGALLIAALGTTCQMLNAWAAIPRCSAYLPIRKLLLKAALRDRRVVQEALWARQKFSQTVMTAEEIEMMIEFFDGDDVAVQQYLALVAKSRPQIPTGILPHLRTRLENPVPIAPH